MNNTKNVLLMSVAAAALIAGISVASAQAPAPAAKQSEPAEKPGPALKQTAAPEAKAPDAKAPDAAKPDQKASESKADIKKDKGTQALSPATKSTVGQAEIPDGKAKAATGQVSAQDKDVKSHASPDTKSHGKTSADMKADANTKANTKADANTKAKTKADAKSPDKSSAAAGHAKAETTGQGAAASLSTEQRTTIRTVIKQQNVKSMTSVNFSISVGARVPGTVRFYRVPMELVQIYPRWRGYDSFSSAIRSSSSTRARMRSWACSTRDANSGGRAASRAALLFSQHTGSGDENIHYHRQRKPAKHRRVAPRASGAECAVAGEAGSGCENRVLACRTRLPDTGGYALTAPGTGAPAAFACLHAG